MVAGRRPTGVDLVIRRQRFATDVGRRPRDRGALCDQPDRRGRDTQGKEIDMASTPVMRADAFGLLPSLTILLMLILASLGIVAHAATL
jgi:hypothetical protein